MAKENNTKLYNTIIIGAGAAGLMCAIQAGKRGQKVLLLDAAKNVGEKIRISGGGATRTSCGQCVAIVLGWELLPLLHLDKQGAH